MAGLARDERRAVDRWDAAPLNPVRLLEDCPPHRLAQDVAELAAAEAQCAVGLYVVDIGGSALCRVAGSDTMPAEIEIGQGVGPEVGRGRMHEVQELVATAVPGGVTVPMWLYGRAVAVLVTEAAPVGDIERLARQAAAAVELADRYTDVFSSARRRIA